MPSVTKKATTTKAADELNPTAASLLGFLHSGPLTGYELVQVAELFIGDFWSLTRSQVYRELTALAARGLVEEGETGPRSRRPFALTSAGRQAFAGWIRRPPGPEQIRYPLLLTLSFGAMLDPADLLGFLRQHRAAHEARLADYEAKTEGLDDPYVQTVLGFGLHYERAVLAWMDEAEDRLRARRPASARRRSGGDRGRARPGSSGSSPGGSGRSA